jgi:hypothetical protein
MERKGKEAETTHTHTVHVHAVICVNAQAGTMDVIGFASI